MRADDDDDEAVFARAEASLSTFPATVVLSAPPGSSLGRGGIDRRIDDGKSGSSAASGGYTYDPCLTALPKGHATAAAAAAAASNPTRNATTRKRQRTGDDASNKVIQSHYGLMLSTLLLA